MLVVLLLELLGWDWVCCAVVCLETVFVWVCRLVSCYDLVLSRLGFVDLAFGWFRVFG